MAAPIPGAFARGASARASTRGRDAFHLFTHPVHACFAVAALLILHALLGAWGLVAWIAVEAALVLGGSRHPGVRRAARRHQRARQLRGARRTRAVLMEQMEPDDVPEYRELCCRVDAARARAASLGEGVEDAFDTCCEPDRLLGAYLRLSIARRALRESSWQTDRLALARRLAGVERQRAEAEDPRLRRVAAQRAKLLRRRLGSLERSERERALLQAQGAALADLCRLIHERVCNAVHSWQLASRVEELVSEVALHEEILTAFAPADVTTDAPLDDALDPTDPDDAEEDASGPRPVLARVPAPETVALEHAADTAPNAPRRPRADEGISLA
ncbi:MAG TPA: hypothetical protein RMH99_22770 [Sandaracinaceae bacterium LLY-WYZ-13_1]|nr:hypothetical protein [Sandaracinaceae bacterium LLY-WYZ-13_1]